MGVKEMTLGVIDTPGFDDTDGIEQDACNLACIQDMLKSHRPLQNIAEMNAPAQFPNVILLLIKATATRYRHTYKGMQYSLTVRIL
jgi:hypothetical protein